MNDANRSALGGKIGLGICWIGVLGIIIGFVGMGRAIYMEQGKTQHDKFTLAGTAELAQFIGLDGSSFKMVVKILDGNPIETSFESDQQMFNAGIIRQTRITVTFDLETQYRRDGTIRGQRRTLLSWKLR